MPSKFRCLDREYSCGVYLEISSLRLLDDSLPLVLGRELGFAEVVNRAQIGVFTGPSEEDGGVVFSLSFGTGADKSLLDRFILPNMPAKLVDDFDFFGAADES